MKKTNFKLLALILPLSVFAQTESPFPILENNPLWEIEGEEFGYPFFGNAIDLNISYDGIQIIGGQEYLSMFEEDLTVDPPGYSGGPRIRIDGKRVYGSNGIALAFPGPEGVLYDFALEVGDTLGPEFGRTFHESYWLYAINSIEILGVPRREFIIYATEYSFSEGGNSFIYESWIEGIGGVEHPTHPSYNYWDGPIYNKMRLSFGDEVVFDSYFYPNVQYPTLNAGMLIPDGLIDCTPSIALGNLDTQNSGVLWLTQENTGSGFIPGSQLALQIPPGVLFSHSDPLPDEQTSNTLIWNMDGLNIIEQQQIRLEFDLLETADIDPNGLFYFFTTNQGNEEVDFEPRSASFSTSVNESSELNDIVAIPRGASDDNYIFIEQPITYTIRFQNNGTDTINVVNILNPISENIDLRTFNFLAASHDFKITGVYDGNVNWEFDNIKLPPSSTDFVGSQGFVQYRISAKQNLNPNTEILNQAYITFDDQEPLETNTFKHTVSSDVTLAVNLLGFSAKWNQDNSRAIEWTLANPLQLESVELERSINKRDFYPIKTILSPQFEEFNFIDELWEPNIDWWYRLKFVEQNGEVSYSEIIKLSDKNNSLESELFEFDPIAKQIKWSIPSDKNQTWEIRIFDQLGRVIYARSISADNNLDFHYQLPSNLNGTYFIRAKSENEIYSKRIITFE